MRIVLLGYGKMGKAIEQIAISRGHEVVARIDQNNREKLEELSKEDVDVAIEFSIPSAAIDNIYTSFEKGWPVVCGTTGWLEHKADVIANCKAKNGGFFYASNYSIGVNLFFKLNKYLAKLVKGHGYDISMTEVHHIHKLDAPSGTAITLAEGIQEGDDTILGWTMVDEPKDNFIPITAERRGEVPGTHIINYTSTVDDIQISHTAHSRQGFALGAVVAAEWMVNKQGVYSMDDMLSESF